MVFGGKVEVVEEYDEEIRSVSLVLRMPAVVRLHRKVRHRGRAVRFSRFNVLLRDQFTCQYCGVRGPAKELTMDHVLPRAKGGGTRWTNVVAACRECNHHKGDRTPDEARMPLAKPPRVPKWLPSMGLQFENRHVPEAWSFWVH